MSRKWNYLRRAYAIDDFREMRRAELDNGETLDDTFPAVKEDVRYILEMAEGNYTTAAITPCEYRTIRQCKKWLNDFSKVEA